MHSLVLRARASLGPTVLLISVYVKIGLWMSGEATFVMLLELSVVSDNLRVTPSGLNYTHIYIDDGASLSAQVSAFSDDMTSSLKLPNVRPSAALVQLERGAGGLKGGSAGSVRARGALCDFRGGVCVSVCGRAMIGTPRPPPQATLHSACVVRRPGSNLSLITMCESACRSRCVNWMRSKRPPRRATLRKTPPPAPQYSCVYRNVVRWSQALKMPLGFGRGQAAAVGAGEVQRAGTHAESKARRGRRRAHAGAARPRLSGCRVVRGLC